MWVVYLQYQQLGIKSELDMITVKAVKECISMFELNLLIEKYQKYKKIMRKMERHKQ